MPKASVPVISNVKVTDIDSTGYTVSCEVKAEGGVDYVQFPTWTSLNGQDDITWEKGTGKDGTYSYRVNIKEHKNESGSYRTYIYAYDKLGQLTQYKVDLVTVPDFETEITDIRIINLTSAGYRINCKINDNNNISKVQFLTWSSEDGQDDLTVDEVSSSNSEYTYDVKISDHCYDYGNYRTYIYVYDGTNNLIQKRLDLVNVPKQEIVNSMPILFNVRVSNVTENGYTITAKVEGNNNFDKVLFPTWTKNNGQDDIVWGQGTIVGNVVTYRVRRSDHNFEYGFYRTHIYAYNKFGQATTVVVPYQQIKNMSYNIGWVYDSYGKKYFYDQNGELVGNGPSMKVIDVSYYNGDIDWNQVKQFGEVDGAILRIAMHPNGSYIEDKQFARNLSECRRLNIPFGVYIYDYAHNEADAYYEADFTVGLLMKYGVSPQELSFPIYYDLERSGIGVSTYEKFVSCFISRCNGYGYGANVYSYRSLLNSELNSQYIWSNTSWIAAYTKTLGFNNPYYSGLYGWQYTSGGIVPGINGYVDISCFFKK